jgi:N-acyl homoserine lactone hydrolase
VIGALPWRRRSAATKIRHVDTEGRDRADAPWRGVALTADGALEAFHTPGHTPGSVTIRLRADQGDLWFIGDTSFRATDVDPQRPTAGIHTQPRAVRALQAWLRDRPGRRTFLPSHGRAVPATLADVGAWSSGD